MSQTGSASQLDAYISEYYPDKMGSQNYNEALRASVEDGRNALDVFQNLELGDSEFQNEVAPYMGYKGPIDPSVARYHSLPKGINSTLEGFAIAPDDDRGFIEAGSFAGASGDTVLLPAEPGTVNAIGKGATPQTYAHEYNHLYEKDRGLLKKALGDEFDADAYNAFTAFGKNKPHEIGARMLDIRSAQSMADARPAAVYIANAQVADLKSQIDQAFSDNDIDTARELNDRVNRLTETIINNPTEEAVIDYVKNNLGEVNTQYDEMGSFRSNFFDKTFSDRSMYRLDGSKKSMQGFLGPIENVNGGTMTEYSIGVEIDGEEVQMPSMVPTLSEDEIEMLRNISDGDPIPEQIKNKAIDHYYQRIEEGKDPFYQDGEDDVGSIEPYEPSLRDSIQRKLADFMGGERDDVYRSKKLMNVLDLLPGTGDATAVADTVDSYNEGDYVNAGINGFAAMLGTVPIIGKPVAKGVKALGVGVNETLTDGKFLKNYGEEAMAKLDELAEFATAGSSRANALINAAVEQGRQVGIRLNLNSKIPDAPAGMDKLQTLHDKNYNGSALSYVPHATVTDVTFSVSQKGRQGIAAKIGGLDVPEAKNKFPAMSVDGKLAPSENVISKGGKGVIEIGFNPKAHHLFIDMKTGQAVKGAEVATVVGDRVYAKGVKYYKKSEAPEPLNASDGTELPSEVRYNEMNKGGTVQRGKVEEKVLDSSTQEELDTTAKAVAETDEIISTPTERAQRSEAATNKLPATEDTVPEEDRSKPELISMYHGGMAMSLMAPDNTVGIDPVSGNPIPIGSSAENVRDDIPAALSEGEFVVPNDVVRWFGLKTYMDMHQEAKMGLMMMHNIGQIKGVEGEYYEEDCGCGEEGCSLCEDGSDDMYGCGDEDCPICMGMDEEGSEEDSGDYEEYPEAPKAQVIVVEEEYPLDEDSEGVESYPTKGGQKL